MSPAPGNSGRSPASVSVNTLSADVVNPLSNADTTDGTARVSSGKPTYTPVGSLRFVVRVKPVTSRPPNNEFARPNVIRGPANPGRIGPPLLALRVPRAASKSATRLPNVRLLS